MPPWAAEALDRLEKRGRVRQALPGWGTLHVERPLPFLGVYRRPTGRRDAGTWRLLLGEASYLLAPAEAPIGPVIEQIVQARLAEFGGFLLLELWAGPETEERTPGFRIVAPPETPADLLEDLQTRLLRGGSDVALTYGDLSLIDPPAGCVALGLEVRPIYRDGSVVFPYVLKKLHRELGRALKQVLYRFAHEHTSHRPPHWHALGRRAPTLADWNADRSLARIAERFDLLLHVTPVNVAAARAAFLASGGEHDPEFLYRPRTIDPATAKRRLYGIPLEHVEDPAFRHLFERKRDQLDLRLSLVGARGTPAFLYAGLQLYGAVPHELFALARDVLERVSPSEELPTRLDAEAFAARAREELVAMDLEAPVEVRDDVSGVLVSGGALLIGSDASIASDRVEALLAHEIGVHLVTRVNGREQPLRLLGVGLAGYETLQEGLAVLAEYLVGQLTPYRLRLVAGRVLAVQSVVDGATFVDTWRLLTRDLGFRPRSAFTVAMRVHRGGGLVKDAIYLRGLSEVLGWLGTGGRLETLLLGKVDLNGIDVIEELLGRGVLKEGRVRPRWLDLPEVRERLERVRQGEEILR